MTDEKVAGRSGGEVYVRLLGGFGSFTENYVSLKVKGEKTLREILETLAKLYGLDLKGFGSYFLVLIDGVEAGLLGGLEAKVKPKHELVLLRVSHGG